jgi:hypothetical protein
MPGAGGEANPDDSGVPGSSDAATPPGAGGNGPTEPPATGSAGEDIACDREFTIPSFDDLPTNAKMPDPFTFLDGSKVETQSDWICRQKEISLLAQTFIYGRKPPKPESLEATYADGTLTLEMGQEGRTWTLSVDITPAGGTKTPGV